MQYNGLYIYNKKKKDFSNEKQKIILEVINESNGLQLNEILEILKTKINEKLINYKLEISFNLEFTPKKIKDKVKQKRKELSVHKRMVQYYLRNLLKQNMIEKKGKKYFPSISVISNQYEIFPEVFGKSMAYSIGYFNPEILEKSLIEYVTRYGLFVIFTFNEFSKLKHNFNEDYKDDVLSDWLQKSIPLNEMYNIFSDLYFHNEIDKVDRNEISSKINSLLEKNYPNHYKMLTEIRNQNLKDLEQSKKDKDKYDQQMKRFENQIDTKILINKDAKVDPVDLISKNMVAYGRVVPKDWYEQLSQIAKDYSNKQK